MGVDEGEVGTLGWAMGTRMGMEMMGMEMGMGMADKL